MFRLQPIQEATISVLLARSANLAEVGWSFRCAAGWEIDVCLGWVASTPWKPNKLQQKLKQREPKSALIWFEP